MAAAPGAVVSGGQLQDLDDVSGLADQLRVGAREDRQHRVPDRSDSKRSSPTPTSASRRGRPGSAMKPRERLAGVAPRRAERGGDRLLGLFPSRGGCSAARSASSLPCRSNAARRGCRRAHGRWRGWRPSAPATAIRTRIAASRVGDFGRAASSSGLALGAQPAVVQIAQALLAHRIDQHVRPAASRSPRCHGPSRACRSRAESFSGVYFVIAGSRMMLRGIIIGWLKICFSLRLVSVTSAPELYSPPDSVLGDRYHPDIRCPEWPELARSGVVSTVEPGRHRRSRFSMHISCDLRRINHRAACRSRDHGVCLGLAPFLPGDLGHHIPGRCCCAHAPIESGGVAIAETFADLSRSRRSWCSASGWRSDRARLARPAARPHRAAPRLQAYRRSNT